MLLTKLEPKKIYRLKQKSYIAYRYSKHYSPWILLILILLLGANIIQKNYLNKPKRVSFVESPVTIKPVTPKPITANTVEKTPENTKLLLLKKQLLAEKEKNKKLSKNLNNQEQQLLSALNNINESYKSAIKGTRSTEAKVTSSSITEISQTEYYNKVRTVLNKNPSNVNNVKVLKKLSTSKKENLISKAEKIEGNANF